jgi:hypothetical protein
MQQHAKVVLHKEVSPIIFADLVNQRSFLI